MVIIELEDDMAVRLAHYLEDIPEMSSVLEQINKKVQYQQKSNSYKETKKASGFHVFFRTETKNPQVLYFDYGTKTYSQKPIYDNGKIIGRPITLSQLQDTKENLIRIGFKEV